MYLTNDMLTVWELAHRLAASDPHKRYWFGLPLPVKDNIRLLMNEIFSYRLTSSLLMEKRQPGSEMPPEAFVRYYVDEIYDCIFGHSIPIQLTRGVSIDRWDFWQWCKQSKYDLPDFWFALEYEVYDDEETDDEETESSLFPERRTPREENRRTREQCRKLAREYWGQEPTLRIAQAARKIQELGIADHFTEKTVVKWIRSFAPKDVKGRSGRPRKP